MRNTVLPYFLLPLFASLSFSLSAAPASPPQQPMPLVSEVRTQHPALNINTADAATLQQALNGIGQAKAQAIVAYREANGPFQSVDELLEIKGIGNALMERNRDKLTLE